MSPEAAPEAPATPRDLLHRAESDNRTSLLEPEVYSILASEGIRTPIHRVVKSPDEVNDRLCSEIPSDEIVVKVLSPEIPHKTEIGGVAFCTNTRKALRFAVAEVINLTRKRAEGATIHGVLIAQKIRHHLGTGREVLAGFRYDRAFGPVVVMGAGGLDTEYLLTALQPEKARAVREVAGLTGEAALEAIRGTVVHAALCGGMRSAVEEILPEEHLAELFLGLASLAGRYSGFNPQGGIGLAELEVNPFVVDEEGRFVALDALARIHRPAPRAPARPVERLRHLLVPESATVIGASSGGMNPGRIILRNLVEGGGVPREKIWVVHPKAAEIEGCRGVKSLEDLPETPDMAVVGVPANGGAADVVVDIVRNRRARSVILISGGFGETEGGRSAERWMREVIEKNHKTRKDGVLVNGGNCLGINSGPGGYNTFFLPPYKLPFNDAPGQNVASISQSGAYLVTQISNLDRAVRPRYAISFGNQIDVTVSDYLEHLRNDEAIRVFAVYLEGFRRGDGARFLDLSRSITEEGRTVLLYKAGRSPEGRNAAASHTAAAVGDYEIARDLARGAGAISCRTLDMFEDYLMTFSFLAERPAAGNRVAVLSNAGFECTAAADKLYGLSLAELAPETCESLRALLPAGVVDVHNPVDTTPVTPTDHYAGCMEALLADPGVDALVVAGVPATPFVENLARGEDHGEDIARESSLPSRLIRIFRESGKPIVFSVDSGMLYEAFVQMMKRAGLPCFRKVDRAMRALGAFLGTNR